MMDADGLQRWGNAYTDEVGRKGAWLQREDGYWTPWHLANATIAALRKEVDDRPSLAMYRALRGDLVAMRRALEAADRAVEMLTAFAGDSMDSECHGALMDWDWHRSRVMPAPAPACLKPAP